MKKIIGLLLVLFTITGCKTVNDENVLKEFSKILNETKSYTMEGSMTLLSNNEEYNYDVYVEFLKGDYYKVSLLNKNNATEQIILKNSDGVYVVTPSINKSFKFQSEWPNNSSQAYILETLLSDIQNDDERKFEVTDNGYIFDVEVNYPNNKLLINQKITFNDKNLPTKVEVFNEEGISQITFNVKNINLKANLKEDNFSLENSVNKDCCKTEESASLESVLYPTYLPLNTTFHSQETINTEDTERVILTFTGEKSFIMVEEAKKTPEEMEVVSVYGDLTFVDDTIGAITDSSVMWTKGNVEYYISSQNLTSEELVSVASSALTAAVSK